MEAIQNQPPKRYIYNDADLQKFLESPAKSELLKLISACGKSCSNRAGTSYQYDPRFPLKGLSPAIAALHGSLCVIQTWVKDFPPKEDVQIRFGNPAFRRWHERLEHRCKSIVSAILLTHQAYPGTGDYGENILNEASERGRSAASADKAESLPEGQDVSVVTELSSYLLSSFGHPVRLDYGTGHESSFQVFLYALCKLGCFGSTQDEPPTATRLKAVTLAVWPAYLRVTRKLQTDYMLEPAGSHGVWGLDDYHCLPFYYGACQLQADGEGSTPETIHDPTALAAHSDSFLYYGCISYIKSLKKGVPFFESSPMLNDISQLPTWQKVATGLLRLYEGEVLSKRQVVQHFVFGNIFKATWTPSQMPREAPTETFRSAGNVAPMARAPWADEDSTTTSAMPPTKAPWAK